MPNTFKLSRVLVLVSILAPVTLAVLFLSL
jgi:hypothetical protein